MTDRRSRLNRSQDGFSLVEAVLAIAVLGLIAVPLSSLVVNQQRARETNTQKLLVQQSMNLVLTTFTNDVRAGIGLTSSRNNTKAFTIRQPLPDGAYTHVTYRFADQRLQRGVSSDGSLPTQWQDVIDPEIFKVAEGSFAYFSIQNEIPKKDAHVRRIELRDLKLLSASKEPYFPPAVSAVMREQANARTLRRVGSSSQEKGSGQDNGATWIRFTARNTSPNEITLAAFRAEWLDPNYETYVDTVRVNREGENGNKYQWNGKYQAGGTLQSFKDGLKLGPSEGIVVEAKFRMNKQTFVYRALRFQFYDNLTDLANPFLVPVID